MRKEWGLRGGGGCAPRAPAEAGSQTSGRSTRSCRRDLGSAARAACCFLLACWTATNTRTQPRRGPGAPREPAGTVPAPAHAAPAPSDAGLRGLDRTVRAACHTVSLRRFSLLKRTELHFPKQIVYHVKTLIKTFALIIRLCAAISLSLGFNGAQLGHMLTQPHCPVLNAISEH